MNWAGLNSLRMMAARPLALCVLHANALFGLMRRMDDPTFADSIRLRTRAVVDANFRPFVDDAPSLGGPNQRLRPGRTEQFGNITIVPVIGPLVSDAASVTDSEGNRFGTTYDEVRAGVESGLASSAGVLLYVDSPGGEAIPSYPLVDYLLSRRDGGKPIGAFVANLAGSAGLHAAVSATRGHLTLTRSSLMDSIGTMGIFAEESKALAEAGITVNLIMSETKHAAGASFKPMTDQERARLQAEISDLGSKFVADVARARGVDTARVKEWASRAWIGQAAVDAGLADAVVADLNEAITRLSLAAANVNPKGPSNMDPKTNAAPAVPSSPAAAPAAPAACNAAPVAAAPATPLAAATIAQIRAVCGDDKAFAFDMLEKGATLDQVKDAWIAQLTARNAALSGQAGDAANRLKAVAEMGSAPIQARATGAAAAAAAAAELTDGDPGADKPAAERCEAIIANLLAGGTVKSRPQAVMALKKNHAALYAAAKNGGWGEQRAQAVLRPLGML